MTQHPFIRRRPLRAIASRLGLRTQATIRMRHLGVRAGRAALGAPLAGLLNLLPLGVRLSVFQRIRHARRRLDFADVPLYLEVTTESERLRLQPCMKEPETVEWLLSYAGSAFVLYDVGANVGVYSLIAAAVSPRARVVAFEPAHTTFPRLVDNVRVNAVGDRVTPLQIALGERTDILTFGYARLDPGAADHPGISQGVDGSVARHPVLCYRLDDLISSFDLPPPTLLKLDVDGAELSVLLGAAETLKIRLLTSVLVELREGDERAEAVGRLLTASGFSEVASRAHAGGLVRNSIWRRAGADAG